MNKDKEWLKEEVFELYPSYDEMYVSPDYETVAKTETISKVLELIDQLDEPEKPVIPKFVAEYIKQSKKDNDSINQVFAFMDDKEDKDLWHWLFPSMYEEKRANQEVFMRAWLDGYTIEKEPQWVVKDDTGYLSYLQFSIPNIYERETSLDKNGAYKFNSKSKADLIANLVTGTVEEVTEEMAR